MRIAALDDDPLQLEFFTHARDRAVHAFGGEEDGPANIVFLAHGLDFGLQFRQVGQGNETV